MSPRARAVLLVLLLVLVTAGPVTGTVAPAATQPPDRVAATQVAAEPAQTTFVVRLQSDGDARWTITMNFSTATEARRAAFDDIAAEFTSGEDLRTLTAIRQASQEAGAATGREMSIERVDRSTRTFNETGQLRLSFTWTNFTSRAGGTLQAGDAFNTTSGTWLRSLDRNQALVIAPPSGYQLTDAQPAGYEVSGGSLRWEGPLTFDAGDLSVRYNRVVSPEVPVDLGLVAAGVAVVGILVVGVYVFRRRDVGVPIPTGGADASSTAGPTEPTTPDTDPVTDANPGGSASNGAVADDGATEEDIDEELLSDEERIERLLEDNGGRMKQANIVTETGWSNAKVSQLLSSMDDADRIDKLRIGRENLISFPDEDVADTNSEDR